MTNTTPPRLIDADGNGVNLGARIVDSNGYHDRLIKVITDAAGAPNGYLRTSRGVRPVTDFEDYVIITSEDIEAAADYVRQLMSRTLPGLDNPNL